MSSVVLPYTVPRPIRRKVQLLRWLVRGYVLVEGLTTVLLGVCLVFWGSFLIDWAFEPSPGVRVMLGTFLLVSLLFLAWKSLFSRLFARLSDSSLALLVERSFPHIDESLVTTIEGGLLAEPLTPTQSELLEHTSADASEKLAQVQITRVFRFEPLVWKSALAFAVVISIVAFAFLRTDVFNFFLQRLQLSPTPWPRRVQLAVIGFNEVNGQRVVNVARDDDFNLEVLASLEDEHVPPEQIEIRYRLQDGRRGRDLMTQIGESFPGQHSTQEYRYEFKNVTEDILFDLVGGDDRIDDLRLHVVERPQILATELVCKYPDYLGWTPQTVPFSGRVEIPEGTESLCQVKVNKPLREVQVYDSATKEQLSVTLSPADPQRFSFPLARADDDRILLIDAVDTDGITNREPYRLLVSVVPDEIPEVSVRLRGIGLAVTQQAIIPLVGTIEDDHGVQSAWIEGQSASDSTDRRELPSTVFERAESSELGYFDLAETNPGTQRRSLPLSPGEKLTLSVKALDAYDLQPEPRVGASQRFVLDVVTDSQLRALLEKRELGLRQRYEAIHEKMIATRELLARIQIEPEPSGQSANSDDEIARSIERDKLRVSGVLQNITQLRFETLGVAEGFEDIVVELENNRIVTQKLTERLQQNIAEPLYEVAEELMPQLENRVEHLSSVFDGEADKARNLPAALIQADEIIEAMQRILDRMLELESYNEIVELLREIVSDQKELNEATRVQRLENLRSLLDE